MKKLVLLSVVAVLATSCSAQEKSKQDLAQNKVEPQKEKPKGSWNVDKELDENGNIIRYDSIYSWSSSDELDGFNEMDRDSLMQKFESRFSQHFSSGTSGDLSGIFEQDSLLMKQFFADGFFGDDFEGGFPEMEKIQERMQAIQQRFLQRQRQPLIPAEPEKSEKSQDSENK